MSSQVMSSTTTCMLRIAKTIICLRLLGPRQINCQSHTTHHRIYKSWMSKEKDLTATQTIRNVIHITLQNCPLNNWVFQYFTDIKILQRNLQNCKIIY